MANFTINGHECFFQIAGRHSSKSKDTASTTSSKNRIELYNNSYYEKIAIQELGPDTHPFVGDSYPENKMIFCIGNLTLQYLNLSCTIVYAIL